MMTRKEESSEFWMLTKGILQDTRVDTDEALVIKRWLEYFPNHQYDTNYGLSESIGPGAVHLGVENVHKVGAIGKAGFGWETRICDEDGNDVWRLGSPVRRMRRR